MSMRVAYDSEIFVRQQRGGISRYFAELIGNFSAHPELDVDPVLLFSRCSNQHLRQIVPQLTADMPELRAVPRGVPRMLHLSDRPKNAFLRYRAGGTHSQGRFDLLHTTYFRPQHPDIARSSNLAVTLYDMIPELLGMDMHSGPHRDKHQTLLRADLIISISQTSADQLHQLLPTTSSKTVVIPLGVSDAFLNGNPKSPTQVDFPYVLYVGSRKKYKGFELLLAALATLRSQGNDLGLAIAGEPLAADEMQAINEVLPASRVHQCTPDDDELAGLYRSAEAFVFPSAMEGFGLPILEALACGCPVVASDIPVFHEVAENFINFFEPGSAEDLARALAQMLVDSAGQAARSEAGIGHARQITWQATAKATAAAYGELA
ncbi:MAG TPA: hypothetical protein DDY88_01080 [Actinobacteria bacterium]|nr:hypothetical protein [Actinomycetota bacterium]